MHDQLSVIALDAAALAWSAGGAAHLLGGPFAVTPDMLAGTANLR
jgi:hypothetical protein